MLQSNWLAIHGAALQNHLDACKLLLAHGASLKILTLKNQSAQELATDDKVKLLLLESLAKQDKNLAKVERGCAQCGTVEKKLRSCTRCNNVVCCAKTISQFSTIAVRSVKQQRGQSTSSHAQNHLFWCN